MFSRSRLRFAFLSSPPTLISHLPYHSCLATGVSTETPAVKCVVFAVIVLVTAYIYMYALLNSFDNTVATYVLPAMAA